MDSTEAHFILWARGSERREFTNFATTLTSSYEQLLTVTETLAHDTKKLPVQIRGICWEGPYFTEKYKGAQKSAYRKILGWMNSLMHGKQPTACSIVPLLYDGKVYEAL